MSAAGRGVDPAALRRAAVLADLGDAELAWFAGQCELVTLAPGETLFRVGEPASWMYVILEGAVHSRREALGPEAPVFRMERGQVSGMLPFSRMTEFAGTGHAAAPTQVARFPAAQFGEMLRRIPVLEQRLVGVMADRVREVTRIGDQTEKLMALGRLSAGLAHELNNPAAAVRRAASDLRGRWPRSSRSPSRWPRRARARTRCARSTPCAASRWRARETPAGTRSSERARGRHRRVGGGRRGVAEPWTVAATLADAGSPRPSWRTRWPRCRTRRAPPRWGGSRRRSRPTRSSRRWRRRRRASPPSWPR
jgi:CRP-like cAMP-binding protein